MHKKNQGYQTTKLYDFYVAYTKVTNSYTIYIRRLDSN